MFKIVGEGKYKIGTSEKDQQGRKRCNAKRKEKKSRILDKRIRSESGTMNSWEEWARGTKAVQNERKSDQNIGPLGKLPGEDTAIVAGSAIHEWLAFRTKNDKKKNFTRRAHHGGIAPAGLDQEDVKMVKNGSNHKVQERRRTQTEADPRQSHYVGPVTLQLVIPGLDSRGRVPHREASNIRFNAHASSASPPGATSAHLGSTADGATR